MTKLPNFFQLNDEAFHLFNDSFNDSTVSISLRKYFDNKIDILGSLSYDYRKEQLSKTLEGIFYFTKYRSNITQRWKSNDSFQTSFITRDALFEDTSHGLILTFNHQLKNPKLELNNFYESQNFNCGVDFELKKLPILDIHSVFRFQNIYAGINVAIDTFGKKPLFAKLDYSIGCKTDILTMFGTVTNNTNDFCLSIVNKISSRFQWGIQIEWLRNIPGINHSIGFSYYKNDDKNFFTKLKFENTSKLMMACGVEIFKDISVSLTASLAHRAVNFGFGIDIAFK